MRYKRRKWCDARLKTGRIPLIGQTNVNNYPGLYRSIYIGHKKFVAPTLSLSLSFSRNVTVTITLIIEICGGAKNGRTPFGAR